MTNPEDSAPNFGIFKFIQSISTFAGYFGLLKLKIQIQVTILGRTLIKTHQHIDSDLLFQFCATLSPAFHISSSTARSIKHSTCDTLMAISFILLLKQKMVGGDISILSCIPMLAVN